MQESLDRQLCEKYPKLFKQRNSNDSPLYWGIGGGDGWFNIVNQLCANIQSHIDWKEKQGNPIPQVEVEQVKEKFGTLRFYYQGGDDYISGLVSMAESMSGVTCDVCGTPGERTGGGWIRTMCPKHAQEAEAERAERMRADGLEE